MDLAPAADLEAAIRMAPAADLEGTVPVVQVADSAAEAIRVAVDAWEEPAAADTAAAADNSVLRLLRAFGPCAHRERPACE